MTQHESIMEDTLVKFYCMNVLTQKSRDKNNIKFVVICI